MSPLRGSALALAVVIGVVVGAAACGGPGGGSGGGPGGEADWPSGETAVDTSGLVYAIGDTVHLADGSTISVGREIERFVLAGGGVFFATDEPSPDSANILGAAPLYYSDGSGAARKVADSAAYLRATSDGRYLAFIDTVSGQKDEFGTAQAEVVVVDLESGDEVARTSEAMGDPGSDDLADLYEDAEPGRLTFDDDTLYYDGVGDVVAIDLATGDASLTEMSEAAFVLPPDDDRTSPDGRWRIVDVDRDYPAAHDRFASADGEKVAPSDVPPILDLIWWVDDITAAGVAVDGGFGDDGFYADGTSAALVTCVVPSGRCTPVEGTSGATVHVPEGTASGTSFTLPDGS